MLIMAAIMTFVLCAAGCATTGGGAVVFAPTPLPLDGAPLRYTHPSGAFSVTVPRDWARIEQHTTALAAVSFAPPNAALPVATFAVVKLDVPLDEAAFAALLDRYQTQIRPDAADYTEQSRSAMGDGSWRFTGRRILTGETGVSVNTFIQRAETLIGVAEVVLDAGADAGTLQTMVNSFAPQPSDALALQATDAAALSGAKPTALSVLHVSAWTTPTGAFYITGEVANYSSQTARDLPIEAALLNAEGGTVAGAVDTVMGLGVPPGGFAPFSLRFGARPPEAVDFRLALGGGAWTWSAESDLVGAESLMWTDESRFDEFGRLIVSGRVTHTGADALTDVRAVATIFDAAGDVIGAGSAAVGTGVLEAGRDAPFEILIVETGGDPANYIVTVQGRRGG
jgi:hypothetical protein